jgi:hypothetical protein
VALDRLRWLLVSPHAVRGYSRAVDEDTRKTEELEEKADESGYGAAEGEGRDAPDQVQPTEVITNREEAEDEHAPRDQAPR